MRITLFSIALLLFLLFWFLILIAWWMTPVSTPLHVNVYEYVFNLSNHVEEVLTVGLPALLISILLMLIDVWLYRKTEIISLSDKMAIVLLAAALVTIGVVFSIYLMITGRFLKGELPAEFGLLVIDTLLVALPPVMLVATLLGHDLRKPFLITLPLVVAGSLLLKFFYAVANLKLTF